MYDLEERKIIEKIKQNNYKTVLLQLPDGLKPKAEYIVKKLEKATNATVITWFGSNFGACDPPNIKSIKIDIVVSFGHSPYIKEAKGW